MDHEIETLTDPAELVRAKRIWAAGYPIPTTLAVALMGLGYDVDQLESIYLK
jgi:hypothetical protein